MLKKVYYWITSALPIKNMQIERRDCSQESGRQKTAQHSVHPTGGSLHVFEQFVWLEVGSDKMAFSRPTHQRVTHTVGRSSSW